MTASTDRLHAHAIDAAAAAFAGGPAATAARAARAADGELFGRG